MWYLTNAPPPSSSLPQDMEKTNNNNKSTYRGFHPGRRKTLKKMGGGGEFYGETNISLKKILTVNIQLVCINSVSAEVLIIFFRTFTCWTWPTNINTSLLAPFKTEGGRQDKLGPVDRSWGDKGVVPRTLGMGAQSAGTCQDRRRVPGQAPTSRPELGGQGCLPRDSGYGGSVCWRGRRTQVAGGATDENC